MTWEVYALRLKGDTEARYIGQSGKGAHIRLREFTGFARAGIGGKLIGEWMRANEGRVEFVVIAVANSEAEARSTERTAISMFSHFGHRLFNRQCIPPQMATLETIEPWTPATTEPRAA